MYRTDFWTLWEKVRVGCSERITLKQVYYQGWNRSPAQVGCMRQVLGPGGMGWGGRREGGSGWETHVNPWLIHVNVWQKPLQYCKVISLKVIKNKWEKMKLKKKRIDLQCRRPGFHPSVRKIPLRREWQPAPVFLPGEFMDRGAWWATVHGVAKSWTGLSD